MEKIKTVEDYDKITAGMESMTCDELIETHKFLIGQSCSDRYRDIEDCGVHFIRNLFEKDWGRTFVYSYSTGASEFIKSKYLSDYYKNSIKDLLSKEELSDEVINALKSDKLINDMSESEITGIYSAIVSFYKKSKEVKYNIAAYFESYLFKLDGKGPMLHLKNNTNSSDLADRILLTSGLNSSASYYAGRGVNYGDLNTSHLVAIFNKLFKFDENYALNFVEMVKKMETLGATEFINTFKMFARNQFQIDGLRIDNNNASLEGVYGESMYVIALCAIASTMGRGNDDDYQKEATKQMKKSFLSRISDHINDSDSEYTYDLFEYNYKKK